MPVGAGPLIGGQGILLRPRPSPEAGATECPVSQKSYILLPSIARERPAHRLEHYRIALHRPSGDQLSLELIGPSFAVLVQVTPGQLDLMLA
ncbi:MAG: hypothetical protein KAY65_10345 [Planctomycetes bacterium]|nr:hypothetical protein [Planctomycetota bacterium]